MRPFVDLLLRRAGLIIVAIAGLCVMLAAVAVVGSIKGQPRQMFAIEAPHDGELPEGADIAGWASVDRDSIYVGQTLKLVLRVVYRDSAIEPDLDTFRRSMTFGRFSSVGVQENRRTLESGVVEYTIEHHLQGINVLSHQSYKLDPAILFFKSDQVAMGELGRLRIATPTIYVSAYYPENVTDLFLRPAHGRMHDPLFLRQGIIIGCGSMLLILVSVLVWRLGYRRPHSELSDAEHLWLEFKAHDRASLSVHAYLLFCESVFARLRQAYTRISPEAFWTASDPDDVFWRAASQRAREILRKNYHSIGASDADIDGMAGLLTETFSAVVAEERLEREQEPSFLRRMRLQPAALAACCACAGLALFMLVLAALPSAWLSSSVKRYNAAVDLAGSEQTKLQAASDLFDLSQQPVAADIKAAALYNSGTFLAELDPLNDQLSKDPTAIVALFKDAASLEAVVKSQATLSIAVDRLKGAAICDSNDEDIRRNLELAAKRHRIVVAALIELLKMQEERFVENVDVRMLLDALNMTLQEDARDNEKAEKPEYYIGEKF